MKKRVLATVLATVLMASTVLSGCGSDGQKETNAGSEEPAQEEDTGQIQSCIEHYCASSGRRRRGTLSDQNRSGESGRYCFA